MGIPHSASFSPLSPLGEACSRMDLTAIHEILESVGYKDDEGMTNEVRIHYIMKNLLSRSHCCFMVSLVASFSHSCSSKNAKCKKEKLFVDPVPCLQYFPGNDSVFQTSSTTSIRIFLRLWEFMGLAVKPCSSLLVFFCYFFPS